MDTIITDFYTDVSVREVRADEWWFHDDGNFLPGISEVPVNSEQDACIKYF